MQMKIGLVIPAMLAAAMASSVEDKHDKECKPVYQGKIEVDLLASLSSTKLSKSEVKDLGARALKVDWPDMYEVEIVFSECKTTLPKLKNAKQGILELKGESGHCLLHTEVEDEKEALVVGECNNREKGWFNLRKDIKDRHFLSIFGKDRKTELDLAYLRPEDELLMLENQKFNMYKDKSKLFISDGKSI